MIILEKDEPCLTDSNLLVKQGGEFAESDLVELYYKNNEDNVVALHALYIKEGRFPE